MKKNNAHLEYMSFGLTLAIGIGGFTYLGIWLDKKLATGFWTLIGVFLGLIYGGYEIWKLIKKTNE